MIDYFLNHKTYFVFSIFILILIYIDINVQHTSETRMRLIKKKLLIWLDLPENYSHIFVLKNLLQVKVHMAQIHRAA